MLFATAYISSETILLLIPEIVLIAAATWIFIAGAFPATQRGTSWFAIGALLIAGVCLARQDAAWEIFSTTFVARSVGPLSVDHFGHLVRWIVLALGLLLLLLSWRHREQESTEYTGALLCALAGLMIVAAANELVLLFLGLELLSIPTYVLLFLARRDGSAQEAGAKYFFLSILASAVLLYGFSFLYGAAGSTRLSDLRDAIWSDPVAPAVQMAVRIGALLTFLGLAFRLTVVPFHFYAPDVYQGTSHPLAGFLATLPKVAGVAAIVRIFVILLPNQELQTLTWQICLGLALVTMTLGNVLALWQDNLRRLMAYSSIAHGGYLLVGLAVGFAARTEAISGFEPGHQLMDGFSATLLYLVVYAIATLGIFSAAAYLGRRKHEVQRVEELSGLYRAHPAMAAALAICLFSLTGLPPLAGFWGKFAIFGGAISIDLPSRLEPQAAATIHYWFVAAAIVGMLNAAISAAYYLRIIAIMYFRPQLKKLAGQGTVGAYTCAACCAALVVGIGLLPGRLFDTVRPIGPSVRQAARSENAGPDVKAVSTTAGDRPRG
ncbi:MAG TPA: NADH-quinone oxidoreductase subunit N [Pirellulales bacterium]|nr:NADH-quinone oxidoreductase subunit N [Pirellulales bacterium]